MSQNAVITMNHYIFSLRFIGFIILALVIGSCEEQISPTDSRKARKKVRKAYEDRLGLDVSHVPLEYSDFSDRWTSTVYFQGTLYRVYLFPNGQVRTNTFQVKFPTGNQSVLIAVVNHAELGFDNIVDNTWSQVLQEINLEHQQYAEAQGFVDPIVQFENTTVLIDPDQLESESRDELIATLAQQGFDREDYDILVFLDIDLNENEGGFADYRSRYVKMGWIYGNQFEKSLNLENLRGLAFAIYHHEIGHIWGWEHEWTSPPYDKGAFITEPVLFGWHDMDGDGVPEVLDSAPYGIK